MLLTCNIVHVTVKKYMSTYTWLHVRSARNFLMAKLRHGPSPNGFRSPSIPFAATAFPHTCRPSDLAFPATLPLLDV